MSTILKKINGLTLSQSSNPLTKSSQSDIFLFCNKSGHGGKNVLNIGNVVHIA